MPLHFSLFEYPQINEKAIFGHSHPVKVGINKSKKKGLFKNRPFFMFIL